MNVTLTSPDWQTLQGTTLEGGYELKDILEAAGDRALLRVRVLGDYTLKAAAAFYVLEPAAAEEQVAIWQSIRYFDSKAAIAVPLGSGKLNLNGLTVAYVVYQIADETLADALSSRALEPEEAIDAVRAMARGLSELHANGFVHGYLAPGELRAAGDRVEVSTESIRRVNSAPLAEARAAKYLAPESGTHNLTIASDIWCLGASVFEALTQKSYEPSLREQAAGLKHPIGTLLEGCLDPDPDQRLKLTDFESILRSKVPPPKPKPVVVEAAAPEPPKAAAATAVSNGTGVTVPEPVAKVATPETTAAPPEAPKNTEPARPVFPNEPAAKSTAPEPRKLPNELAGGRIPARPKWRNEARAEEPAVGASARRGWIYAIAAFVVIFAILWFLRARTRPASPAQPGPQSSAAAPPKPAAAWPTNTLTPEAKTPTAAPEPATPAPATTQSAAPAQSGARTIWRVVLYTYRARPDAEKNARQIAARRPDLHAEVFATSASGPYLVVAGGPMSHEEAARMRARAVREGMPRDSYIQNYSH